MILRSVKVNFMYFWVCLWGHMQKRLAFGLFNRVTKLHPQYRGWASSNHLRAQKEEQKGLRRANLPFYLKLWLPLSPGCWAPGLSPLASEWMTALAFLVFQLADGRRGTSQPPQSCEPIPIMSPLSYLLYSLLILFLWGTPTNIVRYSFIPLKNNSGLPHSKWNERDWI